MPTVRLGTGSHASITLNVRIPEALEEALPYVVGDQRFDTGVVDCNKALVLWTRYTTTQSLVDDLADQIGLPAYLTEEMPAISGETVGDVVVAEADLTRDHFCMNTVLYNACWIGYLGVFEEIFAAFSLEELITELLAVAF